jgi:hypothetical protein
MHRARYLAVGKHGWQSLVAVSNCHNSASHLYVTDQHTTMNFLDDTGADLCVYPVPVFENAGRRLIMSFLKQIALSYIHTVA